ncbi:orotidine-5'-phosphate decarboxylase [Streptomyces pactum]|uniref:orotidine-5'-phosphate decarboxylase n=1 Tax=Streptomyces pactum TaxID=68249 RepID=UPI0036FE17DA
MTTPHPATEPFGVRLRRAMDTRGPLCVGIDPHASLLTDWGLTDDIAGLERFTRTVVEALAERVAVLKPQSAFFERFGSRGVAVLERAVAEARGAGALVLMDAKRGDIGSTMAAYAATYLDPASPLFSDAVTVSPYLGFGSLRPALDLAREHGSGVFVLALTSNPEGAEVQHAVRPGGATVAATVLDHLRAENAGAAGEGTLGSFGAVVGATLGELSSYDLSIGGPLLAPGIGAQGATPADLPGVFGAAVRDVLPSVSRGVLRHGPGPAGLVSAAERFAEEVRAVAG